MALKNVLQEHISYHGTLHDSVAITVRIVSVAALAAACICAAGGIGIAVFLVIRKGCTLDVCLFIGAVVFLLISTGLSAVVYVLFNDVVAALDQKLSSMRAVDDLSDLFHAHQRNMERFIAFNGQPWALGEVKQRAPHSVAWTRHIASVLTALQSLNVPVDLLRDVEMAVEFMWNIHRVSMYLVYAANAKQKGNSSFVPPSPPFISSYNYPSEVGYETDIRQFADNYPDLQYSSPSRDLLRPAEELLHMARFAIFGGRGSKYLNAVDTAISALKVRVLDAGSESVIAIENQVMSALIAFTALSSAAVVAMLAALLAPVIHSFLRTMMKHYVDCKDVVFFDLLNTLIAWFMCLGLFTAQFVVSMLPLNNGSPATEVVSYALQRESSAVRSLSLLHYVSRSAAVDDAALVLSTQQKLRSAFAAMESSRSTLYFSPRFVSNAFGSVHSMSSTQRGMLFDINANSENSLDQKYVQWIDIVRQAALLTVAVELTNSHYANKLKNSYGITYAVKNALSGHLTAVRTLENAVLEGLRESSDQFAFDAKQSLYQSVLPASIMFAAGALVIIIALCHWAPSTARIARTNVANTRIMLHMVPQSARDAAPPLAIYLESGALEEMQSTDVMSFDRHAAHFLGLWKNVDSTAVGLGSCKILGASSRPLILLSSVGDIIYANRAVRGSLDYEYLVGKNMNSLFDPTSDVSSFAAMVGGLAAAPPGSTVHRDVCLIDRRKASQAFSAVVGPAPDVHDATYYIVQLTKSKSGRTQKVAMQASNEDA